ncbi:hypothetical protein [Sporichthya sp.]|uniref:hypothetical protein n=1 Tax=Sporichthya sp. TaxID=65475 RepID=UPI00183BB8B8|nr:hypothetical protein [Sporichthya sp.]MBA3743701.1 hypothetical protein [Sporichthya sp.]
MSIDGLTTVEGIADFLDAEIVNSVPGELRSEVRAAAKLLRTSAVELSVRYREVGAEIDDLLVLCAAHVVADDASAVIDLSARAAGERMSLREQERLRTDVHDLVSRTMARLTVSNDRALAEFLRCLGGHAARRSTWQAVFPGNPAGVSA